MKSLKDIINSKAKIVKTIKPFTHGYVPIGKKNIKNSDLPIEVHSDRQGDLDPAGEVKPYDRAANRQGVNPDLSYDGAGNADKNDDTEKYSSWVAEEEALDEIQFRDDSEKGGSYTKWKKKQSKNKAKKNAEAADKRAESSILTRKPKHTKEETEVLDELSKGLLQRYISKSTNKRENLLKSTLDPKSKIDSQAAGAKYKKIGSGMAMALRKGAHPAKIKATEETEVLDEKNWIAGAIKHPGAEKRAAAKAGESTHEYMEQHKGSPGKAGARARLGLRLSSMRKEGIDEVYQAQTNISSKVNSAVSNLKSSLRKKSKDIGAFKDDSAAREKAVGQGFAQRKEETENVDEAKETFDHQVKRNQDWDNRRHTEIRRLHKQGHSHAEIAKQLKTHPSVVSASIGAMKEDLEEHTMPGHSKTEINYRAQAEHHHQRYLHHKDREEATRSYGDGELSFSNNAHRKLRDAHESCRNNCNHLADVYGSAGPGAWNEETDHDDDKERISKPLRMITEKEPINELSKETLKSYVKKAGKDRKSASDRANSIIKRARFKTSFYTSRSGNLNKMGWDEREDSNRAIRHSIKRGKGIGKAKERLGGKITLNHPTVAYHAEETEE